MEKLQFDTEFGVTCTLLTRRHMLGLETTSTGGGGYAL